MMCLAMRSCIKTCEGDRLATSISALLGKVTYLSPSVPDVSRTCRVRCRSSTDFSAITHGPAPIPPELGSSLTNSTILRQLSTSPSPHHEPHHTSHRDNGLPSRRTPAPPRLDYLHQETRPPIPRRPPRPRLEHQHAPHNPFPKEIWHRPIHSPKTSSNPLRRTLDDDEVLETQRRLHPPPPPTAHGRHARRQHPRLRLRVGDDRDGH